MSWERLSSERREAILRAVDTLFEDLVDDLVREASESDDANAEEVVANVLSDLVASIEEMSDELGFDPYDDDDDGDDGDGDDGGEPDWTEAVHDHYYETLLPKRVPMALLQRLDRYAKR